LIWNLLGAAGVFASLAVALALGHAFGVAPEHSVGLFAGGMTSTPALQAAIDAAGNGEPAIGYSVAYPLGVVGPILCLFVFTRLFQPRVAPAPTPPQPIEITLEGLESITVAELMTITWRSLGRHSPWRREPVARFARVSPLVTGCCCTASPKYWNRHGARSAAWTPVGS
jgi:hypothetical protein